MTTKKTNKKNLLINGQEIILPKEITIRKEDGSYLIPFDMIKYAEPITEDTDEFQWFNYRHVTKKGLDEESMQSLKNSIKQDGLIHPIVCRWKVIGENVELQLIEGERRCRSIRSLIEDNEDCWSEAEKKMLPAKNVYKTIPCKVIIGDDKECLRMAFSVHDNYVDWGEGAKTKIIMKLRKAGFTDDEILDLTKKSITWLREEDHLSKLDEYSFSFYEEGKINRSVALRLLRIENLETRKKYLDNAYEQASKDFQESLSIVDKELEKAEQKLEFAEAKLALEEELNAGSVKVEELKEELEEAVEKVKEKKAKKQILKEKGTQTKTKHLTEIDKESEELINKVLTPGKLKKQQERLDELIKQDGMISENVVISVDILQWIKPIYHAILNGEENLDEVLSKQFYIQELRNNKEESILSEESVLVS